MANVFDLLNPSLRKAIERLGYTSPLPIQAKAIPVVLTGSHTLITAPTGSGKTEAALFPVLSMLLDRLDNGVKLKGARVVYITPLRALNRDVALRIARIAEAVGLSVFLRHGDTVQSDRRRFIDRPSSIVVTTPESLNLMLTTAHRERIWGNVEWIIVDEVHELIDSKRGAELSVVLERLQRISKRRIQRIGLSATLSRRSISEAASMLAFDRRLSIVEDYSTKKYEIKVSIVDGGRYWERAVAKIADLASGVDGSVLVFTNTRGTAEKLASSLARYLKMKGIDYRVEVHHGSLSRSVREEVERGFRKGEVKILVSTSSMELGIDIGLVDLVVQFMSPRQVIAMTQRAGRAGHSLFEVSRGVIITSSNIFEVLESGVIAVRTEKGHLEDLSLPRNSYDVASHQIAALAIEERSLAVDLIREVFRGSGSLNGLGDDEIDSVLVHLDNVNIVRYDPEGGNVRLGRRTLSYFYRVSMIPDELSFHVYDMVTGSRIGDVSEKFVESQLLKQRDTSRFRFVLGGRIWEAVSIDYEKGRIEAVPLVSEDALIPSWEGEIIPVSYRIAREVCSILSLCQHDPEDCRRMLAYRKIPAEWREKVVNVVGESTRSFGGHQLHPYNGILESTGGVTILYSCLGSNGNLALALLLSKLLENHVRVEFDYIPYAIVFRSPVGVPCPLVEDALLKAREMDDAERLVLLQDAVRRSRTYLIRFIRVAKRMGIVDPDKRLPLDFARRLSDNLRGSVVEVETIREIMQEKVDVHALNDYLDNLREVRCVDTGEEPSPLAREVLDNPYIKRDVAVKVSRLAMDKIIESIKKSLARRSVIMLCLSCGRARRITASEAWRKPRCPYCGSLAIAPLPATEYGDRMLQAYEKMRRGAKVRGEERKLAREVHERASLYLNYAGQGLARYVVEALMTYGVGPARAKRILSELVNKGERFFYEHLLRAMEEYAANRQYWSTRRRIERSG